LITKKPVKNHKNVVKNPVPVSEYGRGELLPNEPHPIAYSAMDFMKSIPYTDLCLYQSALSSCAIEDNRLAEICSETLSRFMNHEPVSDRYLLGLAWFIARPKYEVLKCKK